MFINGLIKQKLTIIHRTVYDNKPWISNAKYFDVKVIIYKYALTKFPGQSKYNEQRHIFFEDWIKTECKRNSL